MMNTRHRLLFGLYVSLLLINESKVLAKSAAAQESQCFSIHVRLNGKRIAGPETVILKKGRIENTVSLEGGCFRVPSSFAAQKEADISFTVPGNKVHLIAIPIGFFAGSWGVDLEDKKFNQEVDLPKHARVGEACAVVFHVCEPETQVSQTGCRTVLSQRTGS